MSVRCCSLSSDSIVVSTGTSLPGGAGRGTEGTVGAIAGRVIMSFEGLLREIGYASDIGQLN